MKGQSGIRKSLKEKDYPAVMLQSYALAVSGIKSTEATFKLMHKLKIVHTKKNVGLQAAKIAFRKGFLFSKKVRFLTIGTLEGIAAGLFMNLPKGNAWPKVIHTVLDARRKHLYYQQFKIEGEKIYRDAPGILELDEINRKIRPGDMVAGNGYDRLSSAGNKQIRFVGEECISAKNLIRCYQDERFHSWLTPTDLSLFEPQYLTEGQVQGRA